MSNNDILRQIRYTFDFNDTEMVELLSDDEHPVTRELMIDWLKKEETAGHQACKDANLALFLNNLIDAKRGKSEGARPQLETRLTNNIILKKLKIALDLKDADIIEMLESEDFSISKHELSALFRKKGHKHYRACKDQLLRNFLKAMQKKFRTNDKPVNV